MTIRSIGSRGAVLGLFLLASVPGCSGSTGGKSPGDPGDPGASTLLGEDSLVYRGAFRVPGGDGGGPSGGHGYAYGGGALAFDPGRGSLFMVGHPYDQLVGELSVPEPVSSQQIGELPTAVVLQGLADLTEGHLNQIAEGGAAYDGAGGVIIGGLLPWEGSLVGAVYGYYDAGYEAKRSHFTSGAGFSVAGDFAGMYQVGTRNPAFVGGYMTPIPREWRSSLGGSALTGKCCVAIITRTSMGPSASAFEPQDLGAETPAPATMLVGYPSDHPTLGEWSNTETINLDYNMTTEINGVVFPENTRSVLFFGRQGLGVPCYGSGTSDRSLDRQPVPGAPGDVYCYDEAEHSKGCHAYPYSSYVWAYDASELALVHAGAKQPWQVRPYATWPLELPFATGGGRITGAAYDPATRRIFVSQHCADPGGGYFCGPVVHVFEIR